MGAALLIRINRNIALTSFGVRYRADVRDVLARLDAATAKLKGDTRARLRISAAPALGAKWLVARLADCQRAPPDIELTVSASYDLDLIRRGAADSGMRYGALHVGGLPLKTLFDGYAAQGQVVKAFRLEVWDSAYCIVLSPEATQKPAVATFTDWLQQEAATHH